MRKIKQIILIILLIFQYNIIAQNIEYGLGVIGKSESNKFKINHYNNENITSSSNKTKMQLAGGLYAFYSTGNKFMFDVSLVFTNAKNDFNITQNNSTFISSNTRFLENNFNISYFLNNNTHKTRPFIFLGGQLLIRRWGEEVYFNDIMKDTYWPKISTNYQFGIGVKKYTSSSLFIQPFAGIRNGLQLNTIYDVPFNQIFLGVVFGINKKSSHKISNINKCFNF